MKRAAGWLLGLCCGLPLLAAVVVGGAAVDASDTRGLACLTLVALLAGYIAFQFFAGPDEEEWEQDDPARADERSSWK